MFGSAIDDLARLGRRALVVLVWVLLLVALALATLANLTSGRATAIGAARPGLAGDALPTQRPAQPALSNQNVSGR